METRRKVIKLRWTKKRGKGPMEGFNVVTVLINDEELMNMTTPCSQEYMQEVTLRILADYFDVDQSSLLYLTSEANSILYLLEKKE